MKLDAQSLQSAWQRRNPREQWVLCIAALVVPLLLADTLVWNPWRTQMKSQCARAAQAQEELNQLNAAQAAALPADVAAAKRIEELRQRLVQAERLASDARQRVVSPERMSAQLREVTEARGTVTVVALRSLPVTPVGEPGAPGTSGNAAATGGSVPRLYRHTFELHVEGSYADIARYVESLEQSASVLRWNAVELDASRHPTVAARLEVFTLSEQSSWIQL